MSEILITVDATHLPKELQYDLWMACVGGEDEGIMTLKAEDYRRIMEGVK